MHTAPHKRRHPMPPMAAPERQPAIDPSLARMAQGYGDDEQTEPQAGAPPQQNGPGIIPDADEMESPQRAQARTAMAGGPDMQQELAETPADEAAESPAQQAMEQRTGMEMHEPDREALAAPARHHKRFSPHARARTMKHRF